MERDEFSRLRAELERLYQQPHLPNPSEVVSSAGDRPLGLLQQLQTLWQRASAFLIEDTVDSGQGNFAWWQMHHLRMGACTPTFSEGNSSKARDWLERVYRK